MDGVTYLHAHISLLARITDDTIIGAIPLDVRRSSTWHISQRGGELITEGHNPLIWVHSLPARCGKRAYTNLLIRVLFHNKATKPFIELVNY